MLRKSDIIIGLLGGTFAVMITGEACKNANAPVAQVEEAGTAIVKDECQLMTGITQNQTILTVCATAEEVLYIATLVSGFLRHGQSVDAGTCTPLKGTAVCATPEELGKALVSVIQKRSDALSIRGLEGGTR